MKGLGKFLFALILTFCFLTLSAMAPIIFKYFNWGDINNLGFLNKNPGDGLKNYYAIVAVCATIVIGYSGLSLGFIYYTHKLNYDSSVDKRKRRSTRIELILNELKSLDENIWKISNKVLQNDADLALVRKSIDRSVDVINDYIQLNHSHLFLGDEDVKVYLKLYSFIDKNERLNEKSLSVVRSMDFTEFKLIYSDFYRHARHVFIKNLELELG